MHYERAALAALGLAEAALAGEEVFGLGPRTRGGRPAAPRVLVARELALIGRLLRVRPAASRRAGPAGRARASATLTASASGSWRPGGGRKGQHSTPEPPPCRAVCVPCWRPPLHLEAGARRGGALASLRPRVTERERALAAARLLSMPSSSRCAAKVPRALGRSLFEEDEHEKLSATAVGGGGGRKREESREKGREREVDPDGGAVAALRSRASIWRSFSLAHALDGLRVLRIDLLVVVHRPLHDLQPLLLLSLSEKC